MGRQTAEEKAKREKLTTFFQESEISSMADIQDLFKSMVGAFLENGLEGELEEELGYSKYDYRNKETENSRNGHSRKKLKSSYGEVEIKVPRDRQGEFEPQLVKSSRQRSLGTSRKRYCQCMLKG